MTCVATQEDQILLITERLGLLSNNIPSNKQDDLAEIAEMWAIGVSEIEGEGLTQASCEKMSKMLIVAEERAKRRLIREGGVKTLNWYLGLKLIHQSMELLLPEGANEGQKGCCPFCPAGQSDC